MIPSLCLFVLGLAAYAVGRWRARTALAEAGRVIVWLGTCAVAFALMAQVAGCATRSGGERAVAVAMAATNAARDTFAEWDHNHQMEIAETADPDAGAALLAEYRHRRAPVVRGFTAAYAAIAAAAALVPLVDNPESRTALEGHLKTALYELAEARARFQELSR